MSSSKSWVQIGLALSLAIAAFGVTVQDQFAYSVRDAHESTVAAPVPYGEEVGPTVPETQPSENDAIVPALASNETPKSSPTQTPRRLEGTVKADPSESQPGDEEVAEVAQAESEVLSASFSEPQVSATSSSEPQAAIEPVVPIAPSGLEAEVTCGDYAGDVALTWDATVGSTDGYDVYRSSHDGAFTLIAHVDGADTVSFTDSGLSSDPDTGDRTYSYRVRSTAGELDSEDSAAAHVEIPLSCLQR